MFSLSAAFVWPEI